MARAKTASNTSAANLGFDAKLWLAADKLRNNMDALRQDGAVTFMNPFLPIDDEKRLAERLFEELGDKFSLTPREVVDAVRAAWTEQEAFRDETAKKGEETIREIALPMGLVDVKVCAVDETWSGLKLVVRKENRTRKD